MCGGRIEQEQIPKILEKERKDVSEKFIYNILDIKISLSSLVNLSLVSQRFVKSSPMNNPWRVPWASAQMRLIFDDWLNWQRSELEHDIISLVVGEDGNYKFNKHSQIYNIHFPSPHCHYVKMNTFSSFESIHLMLNINQTRENLKINSLMFPNSREFRFVTLNEWLSTSAADCPDLRTIEWRCESTSATFDT